MIPNQNIRPGRLRPGLLLFNPDNDLALAADLEHYTPPKAAQQLRRDCEVLPMWYGLPDDRVVCHGVNADWLDRMLSDFAGLSMLHDHRPCSLEPMPWGWSKAARFTLRNEGVEPSLLPCDAKLEKLRELSHRRTAALIAGRLQERLPNIGMPHPAVEVRSVDEAKALMLSWGAVYVKQPWSGSGRGVICSEPNPEAALRAAETWIRTHGSAMVEPALPRLLDFARLFRCRGGEVEDLGTSVFTTDALGHYTGNLLAPEPVRFAVVAAKYPADNLLRVFEVLRDIIREEIAPHYDGILGVDMLISTDGRLHPAVELNLRHTMGYAANRFAELHLHPDAPAGRWYTCKDEKPLPDADFSPESYTVADGRLLHGSLRLTPPSTTFTVRVEIP